MYFVAVGQRIINLDRVTQIGFGSEKVYVHFGPADALTLYDTEAEVLREHLMTFTNVLKEKENKAES